MIPALLLLFMASAVFVGCIFFAGGLALFFLSPTLVHRYLEALVRKDAIGKLARLLSSGPGTKEWQLRHEKVLIVLLRIVWAIFILFGALVIAHGLGLKTWIFDT